MVENDEKNTRPENRPHTKVSGALNQHTPPYWRLALPALGARYVFRYAEQLYKHDFFDKLRIGKKKVNAFDIAAGLWMTGITTYFTFKTAQDMKNVYQEAVAYETDKNPKDVGVLDLLKSDNLAIQKSLSNLRKYSAFRYAVNGTFFGSLLPHNDVPFFKEVARNDSVDLGVGANSMYLASEVIFRKRTFFEELQNFVDTKLNQNNALGGEIQPIDLVRLYEKNALDNDKQNAFKDSINSPLWHDSQVIFKRMADLMNDTYQHRTRDEKANFTLPKFIYMVGHNLIQPRNVEQSLAFIQVADDHGIPALKEVMNNINSGETLEQAMDKYPGIMDKVNSMTTDLITNLPDAKSQEKQHQRIVKSADSFVERAKQETPTEPGIQLQ